MLPWLVSVGRCVMCVIFFFRGVLKKISIIFLLWKGRCHVIWLCYFPLLHLNSLFDYCKVNYCKTSYRHRWLSYWTFRVWTTLFLLMFNKNVVAMLFFSRIYSLLCHIFPELLPHASPPCLSRSITPPYNPY